MTDHEYEEQDDPSSEEESEDVPFGTVPPAYPPSGPESTRPPGRKGFVVTKYSLTSPRPPAPPPPLPDAGKTQSRILLELGRLEKKIDGWGYMLENWTGRVEDLTAAIQAQGEGLLELSRALSSMSEAFSSSASQSSATTVRFHFDENMPPAERLEFLAQFFSKAEQLRKGIIPGDAR